MADPLALPAILGRSALDAAGANLAVRGAKVGAALAPTDKEDTGRTAIDTTSSLDDVEGMSSRLLAPSNYAESPSLFFHIPFGDTRVWTPFMQVGTVAGVENDWLRITMDLVLDPINLASFGTAGAGARLGAQVVKAGTKLVAKGGARAVAGRALTGVGRFAETSRLTSGLTPLGETQRLSRALVDNAKAGRTGAEVVKAMDGAMELAFKIRGSGLSDDIIKAAKEGDAKALRKLLESAIKTGKASAEDQLILRAMRRDSRALANMLDKSDELAAMTREVPELFLQQTTAELKAAGSINTFGFNLPKNPIREPIAFTRQMLGFGYRGERINLPGSKLMADGLDLILAPGGSPLPKSLQLGPKLEAISKLETRNFIPGHDTSAFDFVSSLEPLRVVLSSPRERASLTLGVAEVDKVMFKEWKRRAGKEFADTKLSDAPKQYATWRDATLKTANKGLAESDAAATKLMNEMVDQGVANVERLGNELLTAPKTGQLLDGAAELVTGRQEQVRRVADLLSLDSIVSDGFSMGNGFAARQNMMAQMASNVRGIMDDALIRQYDLRGSALVKEVLPALIENLDSVVAVKAGGAIDDTLGALFKLDEDGFVRAAVPVGELRASNAFIDDAFEVWGDTATNLFYEKGFTQEAVLMAGAMRGTLDDIGLNLVVNEGILKDVLSNYFPRVFRPNAKFFNEFGGSGDKMRQAMEGMMGEGDALTDFSKILDRFNVQAPKGKGLSNMEEARKASNELAVKMEKAGLGTYNRDSGAVFAGYLDSANNALMMNSLMRDLPQLSPKLARSMLGDALNKRVSNEQLKKLSFVMADGTIPKGLEDLYTPLTLRGTRTEAAQFSRNKALARAVAATPLKVDTKAISKAEQLALAKKAAGQKSFKINGEKVRLIDAKTGDVVPFKESWLLDGKYPPNSKVKNASRVKDEMQRILKERSAKAIEKATEKATKSKFPSKAEEIPNQVWVFKEGARPIIESFRMYGGNVGSWTRAYDRWNYKLKSLLLYGDVFHYNVLAFQQAATDPSKFLRNVLGRGPQLDEFGQAAADAGAGLIGRAFPRAPRGATVGAAGGAIAGGVASDGDAGSILTGGLIGATYGALLGSARQNALHIRRSMQINPGADDTLMWMGLGGWRGRPDDSAIGAAARQLDNMVRDIARGTANGAIRALRSPITGLSHFTSGFDRDLWQVLHNGSKHMYFSERWGQLLPTLQASKAFSTEALTREFLDLKQRGNLDATSMRLDRVRKAEVPLAPKPRTALEDEFFVLVDDINAPATAVDDVAGLLDDSIPDVSLASRELDQIAVPQGPDVDPRMRKFIASRRFELKRMLAAQLMQSANDTFGGQAFANLLKDPATQFPLRRFLLAPDWTLSRLHQASSIFMAKSGMQASLMGSGLGALAELASEGWDPDSAPWRGIVFGSGLGALANKWSHFTANSIRGMAVAPEAGRVLAAEARRITAAAVVGGYVFSSLATKGFTGHWMHENEEGKRLSMQLPGTDNLGRPRFLTLGKSHKEAMEFAGVLDTERLGTIPVISRVASKMAVMPRFAVKVLNNDSGFGPIVQSEDDPGEVIGNFTAFTLNSITPISATGPVRLGLQAAQIGAGFRDKEPTSTVLEAAIRAAGFPISKGDGASPTDVGRLTRFLDAL